MRRRPFAVALILAACLAPGLAPAQSEDPAPSLPTLSQALDAAWQRTARSAAAAGEARRAQAERPAATALWAAPPAVEVGIAGDRQRTAGTSRETEVGVSVPLWLPGQRDARIALVDAEIDAAEARARAARLALAGEVREAAAAVALSGAEVLAAQSQARELEALARDVDLRVAAGELARADALQAHAEHLAATTEVVRARQALQAAQGQWQALTGMRDTPALTHGAAPSAASGAHPALHAAAREVAVAQARLDLAKASRREAPEFVVRARHEVSRGEPDTRGLGVALRLPLGTDDRQQPLLAAALSDLDLAQATQRALGQQLDAEAATARQALASAQRQLDSESARAALLRERATLVEKSFKAGESALPEMLRALAAAAQADAAIARARAALSQSTARLAQALGVLP